MRISKFLSRNSITPSLARAIDEVTLHRVGVNYGLTLSALNSELKPGESVLAIAVGGVPVNEGVLAVTDRRIILIRDNMTGRHYEEMLVTPGIMQYKYGSGMLGSIVITTVASPRPIILRSVARGAWQVQAAIAALNEGQVAVSSDLR